jgi:hypothetical protein
MKELHDAIASIRHSRLEGDGRTQRALATPQESGQVLRPLKGKQAHRDHRIQAAFLAGKADGSRSIQALMVEADTAGESRSD